MPLNKFRRGFLDGWASIRGTDPAPKIPTFAAQPGVDPYRVGIARGVAAARAEPQGAISTEARIDNALGRPQRPKT